MVHTPIHLTLSDEQSVQFVCGKVQSGEYPSESDVVQETIGLLRQEEDELERWLVEVGSPAYDRMKADSSRAIPLEQVKRHL